MLFLLHRIGNLLAYVAALFVASVSKLSRDRGADARTVDSKLPGSRTESATVKVLIFKAYFHLLFHFIVLFFVVFLLVFTKRGFAYVSYLSIYTLIWRFTGYNFKRSLCLHKQSLCESMKSLFAT